MFLILGAIPGPILLGALIDSVCTLWETDACDGSRNCWLYDNADFSEILLILTMVLRGVSLLFLVLSLVFYEPSGQEEE